MSVFQHFFFWIFLAFILLIPATGIWKHLNQRVPQKQRYVFILIHVIATITGYFLTLFGQMGVVILLTLIFIVFWMALYTGETASFNFQKTALAINSMIAGSALTLFVFLWDSWDYMVTAPEYFRYMGVEGATKKLALRYHAVANSIDTPFLYLLLSFLTLPIFFSLILKLTNSKTVTGNHLATLAANIILLWALALPLNYSQDLLIKTRYTPIILFVYPLVMLYHFLPRFWHTRKKQLMPSSS